jgi:hypothetical protein
MKNLTVTLLFIVTAFTVYGQAKIRKLSNIINHPSVNVYAPYTSFDGNALVFLSDNSEDNVLTMFYAVKENADWKDPIVAPKQVNTRLNFLHGYALSADGKKLYFTSTKSPGVGGYDILVSDLKGTNWSDPQNLGMPINTKGHEACPSFTTDGNTLYFMRAEKMDQNTAQNSKIYVANKKPNGQWDEPVELPAVINTGNSQTPRIMADGQTLIFSSDKLPGNKGGMDLYVSKLQNGSWGTPMPLDFVNTDKDDQYVSVNALGRYLLKDTPGPRKNELVEYLIPNELRPKGMMKVDGTVTDPSGIATPAYVSVIDLASNKRIYNGRPDAKGTFLLYLMEGSKYEVSIDPEQSNVSYASKQYDLTTDKIPQSEKLNAVLKPIGAGDELSLDGVQFKTKSSDLDPLSFSDLKRLSRIIKSCPQLKFEIQVLLNGYKEDTIRSNPDLTEMVVDSIKTQYDDIDSLGQLYKHDTIVVKTTFHNDRTQPQAIAVTSYLISQGVDPKALKIFVNAIPATVPENKKTTVKAVARAQ